MFYPNWHCHLYSCLTLVLIDVCRCIEGKKKKKKGSLAACALWETTYDVFGFWIFERILVPLLLSLFFFFLLEPTPCQWRRHIVKPHEFPCSLCVLIYLFCFYYYWLESWECYCTTCGIRAILGFNLLVRVKMTSTKSEIQKFCGKGTFLSSANVDWRIS